MYALAKELNLDSKVLVDICTKAGVPGKGSALASLTDEEVVKVKEFMSGGGRAAKKPAAAPAAPTAPSSPATPTVPPSIAPPPRPSEPGVVRREDYIAPGGQGRIPVLDVRNKRPQTVEKRPAAERPGDAPGAGGRVPPQRTPAIILAPLPTAEQPRVEAKSNEPAPQKPDLKLPADAIRASKTGARPLAAHLRRHEMKAKADAAAGVKPAPAKTLDGAGLGRRGGAKPPVFIDSPVEEGAGKAKGRKARTPAGKGVEEEGDAKGKQLLGGREARQLSRKRGGGGRRSEGEGGEEGTARRRLRPRIRGKGSNTAAPRKGNVVIDLPCTVRSFSEATGVSAPQILKILLQEGAMGTLNSVLDADMAELIASDLGIEAEFRKQVSLEEQVLAEIRDIEDAPENLQTRPPVITFLGHVDHGKTSLIDRILNLNVASGESGGITQHIRAYQVDKEGRKISFVDTPGHEAFTEMRARGANVTDIAVLVVAADDGVMPQTEEALNHARAAGVPIVVALNKTDLPGVDINRAMQQLSANELLPSEWGGDVEVVRTSAITGAGIDQLLETLLTVAELHDYKANADRPAYGTCLEAQQEAGRGVVAKLIVQSGTLRVGDIVVCGQAFGRVKAMYDTLDLNRKVPEAGPSMPVNVTGFDEAPAAGEHFYVLQDIAQARQIAERRIATNRAASLVDTQPHVTLENLFERLGGEGDVKTLNIILRADVRGSIEAIRKELTKLEHAEVKIKVLQAMVGGVTEADVHLADASDAIIIGFNVVPDEKARALADSKGVQVRRYEIIYKVTEDLKAALEGMLTPEEREVDLGRAIVQKVYTISRVGQIAGCRVLSGTIQRNSRARLIRNSTITGDYALSSLRRVKDDVKEVREGMECGIKLEGFNDLKEGDVLEVYRIEEIGRKFDE